MTTQYVRESVHSRLFPFRQAIEEINSRREDGRNGFNSDEPAVGRLLNAIDFIFNTDVEHPGEFFDFIKCALDSVPRQTLTHQPLEQVLARGHDDRVENFRMWIVYSLNLTGSLKHALHVALPMRDVLSCFVRKDSILFMDTFIDEFLGTLATLHNPPMADGQTTFKLDAGALQLFVERPIQVLVPKKRIGQRSNVARRPREAKAEGKARPMHPHLGERPKRPLQIECSVQTDADVQHVAVAEATSPILIPGSPSGERMEAGTMTDHPSPLMTFQELMEAQDSIEELRTEQRMICERLRGRENEVEEVKREYAERMEIVVATIRQLKGMYNELFMRSLEAQDELGELSEADVDARILDVFAALKHGATKATRDALHDAVVEERSGHEGRRRAGATTHRGEGNLSPAPSPRPQAAPEKPAVQPMAAAVEKKDQPTKAEARPSNHPAAQPPSTPQQAPASAGAKKSAASPGAKPSAAPAAAAVAAAGGIVNSYQLDENANTPLSSDTMIPVDHTKLITAEPTEFERPQQLELQANRCASCGAVFGEGGDRNLVLKVVQKAGETLRLQKPRRCHYCVRLFCHRCHTNKMAVLPFRVLQRWDFAPQHVCNRDYEFLAKNAERAFYCLPSLPNELQARPNVQQVAFLRSKLILLCKIVSMCSHDKATVFSAFLHTHYAQKQFFYSLADFSRLRSGEGNRLMMAAATPINAVGSLVGSLGHAGGAGSSGGPSPSEDLISFLTTLFTKLMQHVKECRQCVARSSMRCGLCTETSPVSLVDDDAVQCKACLSIYHSSCLEIAGGQCPACRK